MSTYTQILYQIVFSTKFREPTMAQDGQQRLYQFIAGILKTKKCHLYQINGVENHLHIITDIHPMLGPAQLVKDIKLATTAFLKETEIFPSFRGWQCGYGAFTYSITAKERLIAYVKNQKEHHRVKNFR
ncbi:transposase [Prolixibacter sp. SD074]|uniref:transposase n=1 Tax=Prolixibacter sp. SD074 TaxID=2652391 RepID=UPI0012991D1C|nr:transposase [Prolixibacter sp. SD074]